MLEGYNSIAPSEIRTPPNNGQRTRSQCVRYSEVPLYIYYMGLVTFTTVDVGHVMNTRSKVRFSREVRARYSWFQPWTTFSLERAMSFESPKWTEGLSVAGLYYDGIVDEGKLDEVLELHKRDTVSTFGTRI